MIGASPLMAAAPTLALPKIYPHNHTICAQQAHAALVLLRRGYAAPQQNEFFLWESFALAHPHRAQYIITPFPA
jgi:hypothetical protein